MSVWASNSGRRLWHCLLEVCWFNEPPAWIADPSSEPQHDLNCRVLLWAYLPRASSGQTLQFVFDLNTALKTGAAAAPQPPQRQYSGLESEGPDRRAEVLLVGQTGTVWAGVRGRRNRSSIGTLPQRRWFLRQAWLRAAFWAQPGSGRRWGAGTAAWWQVRIRSIAWVGAVRLPARE